MTHADTGKDVNAGACGRENVHKKQKKQKYGQQKLNREMSKQSLYPARDAHMQS